MNTQALKKPKSFSFHILFGCLLVFLFTGNAFAALQKVAILPFEINSEKNLDYLQAGINRMLTTRLTWKDKVVVTDKINFMDPVLESDSLSRLNLASKIAVDTGSDFVISGSVTEFAGTFSIDSHVVDVKNQKISQFYAQAASIDQVIPQLDILAAKINMDLFNRMTPSLVLDPDKQASSQEKIRRANPEILMNKKIDTLYAEEKPFWKFWGDSDPEEDVIQLEQDKEKPFWKFWGDNEQEETVVTDTSESTKDEKPFWKFWRSGPKTDVDDMDTDEEEDKKPFWKFWDRGPKTDEDDPYEDEEKEDKPFWKFW